MAKRRSAKRLSKEARQATFRISAILTEVPEEEWGFVLKHAKKMAELAGVVSGFKALGDLYKKL